MITKEKYVYSGLFFRDHGDRTDNSKKRQAD
jgi:hypothetical protein